MKPGPEKLAEAVRKERRIPTVSTTLGDGTMVEMVVQPAERRSSFVLARDGNWRFADSVVTRPGVRLVPYSPRNNLLAHEVVLFPSEPEEYGSEDELSAEVRAFIYRYVDVTPLFLKIAAYYVLLTWVYDRFNELPYLRLRGEPGSGKTRFLLTVGSLCYKPIFASGASTVSPLFRIIDTFRGTLVIDEGDFRLSDERAEVVKILNNGNAKGFPVLRTETTGQGRGEFNPKAYEVYGPKLIATRSFFRDRALESRCLTEETGGRELRTDIPISLPGSHKEEALRLRNKLLMFRFRTLKARTDQATPDRAIEPRLSQIFLPLLSVISNPKDREEMKALARRYHGEMIAERGMDMEAQILEVIRDLRASPSGSALSVGEITSWFADRHGDEYERKVTNKWIGSVLRRKLHLRPVKTRSGYVIAPEELPRLKRLYERYGVNPEEAREPASEDRSPPVL